MPNPTPQQREAARYAAWRRMHRETIAIQRGSRRPEHSPDLPHVAAYLASQAEYQAALQMHGSNAEGRRIAHQIRINAEARYVDALMPEEIDHVLRKAAGASRPT